MGNIPVALKYKLNKNISIDIDSWSTDYTYYMTIVDTKKIKKLDDKISEGYGVGCYIGHAPTMNDVYDCNDYEYKNDFNDKMIAVIDQNFEDQKHLNVFEVVAIYLYAIDSYDINRFMLGNKYGKYTHEEYIKKLIKFVDSKLNVERPNILDNEGFSFEIYDKIINTDINSHADNVSIYSFLSRCLMHSFIMMTPTSTDTRVFSYINIGNPPEDDIFISKCFMSTTYNRDANLNEYKIISRGGTCCLFDIYVPSGNRVIIPNVNYSLFGEHSYELVLPPGVVIHIYDKSYRNICGHASVNVPDIDANALDPVLKKEYAAVSPYNTCTMQIDKVYVLHGVLVANPFNSDETIERYVYGNNSYQ